MTTRNRCFISAPYDTDISLLKNVLAEHDIETFDIYDFSIGESIQQILKRKIRQADFAIFVIANNNTNILYEIGVCEGVGKQHFVFFEKEFNVPVYLESKLFIRANLKDRPFLNMSVEKILQAIEKKPLYKREKSEISTSQGSVYNKNIKANLTSYLKQIRELREIGHGREVENVIGEIFKSIRLNYVENSTNKNNGVDFALWSDEIGKIIGNPIIVEVKYGDLSYDRIREAEKQLNYYISKSDVRVALLLYLDKQGRRYKIKSSLSPLVIGYDIEDFALELLTNSFERLILGQRNKIAHSIE